MSNGSPHDPSAAHRASDLARSARVTSPAKLRYLRAAAQLAAQPRGQDTFPYAVSRVTMADVAADLGVARTTLYKQWSSQLDFWADLITYIASTAAGPTPDDVATSLLNDRRRRPGETMEHARLVLNGLQASQLTNAWMALRTALLGYAGNDRLDAVVARATRREIDEIARQVERIFTELGVEPRSPLTARDVAVAVFCITDGLTTAGRLSPRVNHQDITIDGEAGDWGMLAFALRAIVRRCTTPRTGADTSPADGSVESERPLTDHPAGRWTDAQRAALAAGARRFVSGTPSGTAVRPPNALGHVTLARLARHTGVSRQSLHRVWPNQQAFGVDLVAHLVEERCEQVLLTLRQALRRSMKVNPGGWLVAADHALRMLVGQASHGPLTHLIYAAHDNDPVIRDRCRAVLESMLDRVAADLETVAHSSGTSTRDGITFFHLATISTLTELAAARLERTSPGSVRRGLAHRGGEWSTIAIVIDGIVASAMRPTGPTGNPRWIGNSPGTTSHPAGR